MMIEEFNKKMVEEFEVTYLGLMRYFLRMHVKQTDEEMFIIQVKYYEDLLKKLPLSKLQTSGNTSNIEGKAIHE